MYKVNELKIDERLVFPKSFFSYNNFTGFFLFCLFGVFFVTAGDNVTATQLFTHQQKHVAFGNYITCCTWKNLVH